MTRARSSGSVGIRRRVSRALMFAGMVLVALLLLATPVDAARRPPFPFPDPGEDTTTTTATTTTPTTTTPTTTTPTTTTPTTTRPRRFPPPPVTQTTPTTRARSVVTTRPVPTTRSRTKGSTGTNPAATKTPAVQGFGATAPTTARGKRSSSTTRGTTVAPDASGVLLPGSAAAADPATPAGTDPLVQVAGRSVTRNKGVPVQLVATDQGGDDNSLILGAAGVVGVVLIGSLGFVLRSTRRPDSH